MPPTVSYNEADLAKWTNESIIYRPFFTTWIGAWLIFFGVTVLLLASLFLEYRPKRADWTSFWGMVLVLIGGTMFSASTFINQPILLSVGGIFLTLGLGLYMAFLAWDLHDDYNRSQFTDAEWIHESQHRAVLGMIAMITVLIGIAFFVRKSVQRFIRPYFGPNNFYLYGPMLFGSGAFTYFLLNIKFMADIDSDKYKPTDNSTRFGGYLFSLGAFILLLAVSRSYYSYDLLIVPSFPSLVERNLSSLEAVILCITSGLMAIGGFLFVVGETIMYEHHQFRMITATSVLLSIGYFGMAFIFGLTKEGVSMSMFLGRVFQGFAMAVFALSAGLKFSPQDLDEDRLDYASDIATASAAIGLVASMLPFISTLRHSSPELLSPGNFGILGDLFSFSGFMTLFLVGLSTSTNQHRSCLVTCNGAKDLGAIFFSGAAFMYFFHHILALDLATIFDPLPTTFAALLLKLKFPVWLINKLVGETSTSSSFKLVNPKHHNNISDLIYDNYNHHTGADSDNTTRDESSSFFPIPEDATVLETSVFIVGCGPTGLCLANEVGQRGVDTIIIDSREQVLPDSRFFNLMYTTVEGLKRLGVMTKIYARAIPEWFGHGSVSATGFAHDDAKVIGEAHGPGRGIQKYLGKRLSPHIASMVFTTKWVEEPSIRIMQGAQEECLKERAEEVPSIQVKYGWELVKFHDSDPHSSTKSKSITAMIRHVTTNEIVYVKADYLVGCDGPSSLVSKILKAKFDGFANLGQTRTIHFRTTGLLKKIQPVLGEVLQYHVSRPGFGVGWFVLNYIPQREGEEERWTFFLMGLCDGRQPRQLSKQEMMEVLKEFVGSDPSIEFHVVSDAPWFWNMFFARRIVYGHSILAGDSFHSWPPFGGVGGNTGYLDSNNLGWKLAAVCNGWGNEGMLLSYDIERRQAGLKIIMMVLNFAPDRSQLMRLASIAKYPWLWWTVRFRWLFASKGQHAGNHYANDGVFLGSRYHSHIVYYNKEQQGIPPLESPPSKYTPSIVSGGRLPHIRLSNGSSLNDKIAFDGYTLLVIDPSSIRVKDIITIKGDIESFVSQSFTLENRDMMNYPAIVEIAYYFHSKNIPLKIVDLRNELHDVKDPVESVIVKLYKQQLLVLVRPDLYINWNLTYHSAVSGIVTISTSELMKVAAISCAEIYNEDDILREKLAGEWLTRRFISNIDGYRHLHKTAIYFENQDKAAVMNALIEKQKAANPAAHAASQPITLVSKAVVWDGEAKNVDGSHGNTNVTDANNSSFYHDSPAKPVIDKKEDDVVDESTNVELGDIYQSSSSHGYASVPTSDNPSL